MKMHLGMMFITSMYLLLSQVKAMINLQRVCSLKLQRQSAADHVRSQRVFLRMQKCMIRAVMKRPLILLWQED